MTALLPLCRTLNLVFGAVLFGSMIMEYMLIIPLIRGLPASDGKLRSWPLEAVPAECSQVMQGWSAQHTLRTLLYGTGFVLFVIAAVWWR
jgi:hypothetical protein